MDKPVKDMAFLLNKYGAKVGATDDFQADVLEVFETLKHKSMKTKIIKSEPAKDFKPFKIEIEVETIQEARALFHVANNSISAKICYEHAQYRAADNGYSHDFNNDAIPGDSFKDSIRDEIESQGFKI